MAPRYELLDVAFSTADSELPRIISENGRLWVTFVDWREQIITLVFHDVVAYSWDDEDAAVEVTHRDDCCYVVHDSAWLSRHREVGTLMQDAGHHHYKLCFNAAGVLQVLALRLEVASELGCA